jgi:hypothetical protein
MTHTPKEELIKQGLLWRAENTAITPRFRSFDDLLQHGTLHEWFALRVPVAILAHLACEVIKRREGKLAFWIGEETWPSVYLLSYLLEDFDSEWQSSILPHFIFLNPRNAEDRFWALSTTLSSASVSVVVTTLGELNLNQSLQLTHRAKHSSAIALIGRKNSQINLPSTAKSRWLVTPLSNTKFPTWELKLLHMRGSKRQFSTNLTIWERLGGLCI